MSDHPEASLRWYHGITSYQWLVLVLASAGWVFDVFEGQIFAITRDDMLKDLLGATPDQRTIQYYGDVFLGVFLIGGTLGGIVFGSLADRWGRRPMLIATILTYSLFSGLTYWADSLEAVGILRFLVAVGVGGEWAVAAALVAEEFPTRARAQASGIFHATSILGTWLAGLAGLAVAAQWRYAYLLGILPALLVVAIRFQLRPPRAEVAPSSGATTRGSLVELLTNPRWRLRAVYGLLLATTGLATFWAVTIAGQDLTRQFLIKHGADPSEAQATAKFAYSIVETAGGGIGLLAFGPMAARWGRRRAFLFYQAGAVLIVPIVCYAPASYEHLLVLLPIYGFFTLGMHAGFAVYFPELFPTSLRATGAGFCFNGGRLVAASILFFSGWLKTQIDLRLAVTLLGLLFVPGMLFVMLLPETKDQPLPE
jgi:MFS family permease